MSEQSGAVDVYEELERVKQKCFRLREQIRAMHAAFDGGEIASTGARKSTRYVCG